MTQVTTAKKIAITGIGGFIGFAAAKRAIELGYQVSGLELSSAAAEKASAIGAEVVIADINNAAALASVTAAADAVIHTVAVVAEDGPRKLYEKVNNDGTQQATSAAAAARVKHFIHLSSIMVYGFDYPLNVTEAGPFSNDTNPYNQTKLSSERIALKRHGDNGMSVTIIRPGDVYGRWSQPWWLRPVEMLNKGQFMLPDGGNGVINHVNINNLIDAIFLALDKPDIAGGEAYNITDNAATRCKQFFDYHRRAANKQRIMTLPAALMKPTIGLLATAHQLLGKPAPATAAAVDFLNRRHKISCTKAQQQLGYQPRISLAQGMQAILKDYDLE